MVRLKREKDQQFSTFVKIANDDIERWIEDPRLKRNQRRQQALLQETRESDFSLNFWVSHWHQHWTSSQTKLPRYHLYAYLQGPCYWSAQNLSSRFNPTNFGLADCFQTAFEKSDKILQSFNPDLGTSLSTYAGRAFSNAIQDALGQSHEVKIASELSLLKRCTAKHLSKVLISAGLSSEIKATHTAAWESFQGFYFPQETTARTLGSLLPEDWTTMLSHYRFLSAQQGLRQGSEALLQEWLGNCVLHLRHYAAPQSISLNASLDHSEEFLEQLGDDHEEQLILLIAQEQDKTRQQQQQDITALLQEGLSSLNPASQKLLQLYYGEKLTQQEIATQLGKKQYQVSRQLRAPRQALLKVLLTWSRTELHISFESAVLNNMTVILEDWLKVQFSGERNQHVDV